MIAGLAVTAGIEPSLGPLATAYVLILVVLGPLTARYTQPLAARLTARFGGGPRRADVTGRFAGAEARTTPGAEVERPDDVRRQTTVAD